MKEMTGVILGYNCHNSTSSYDAVILIKVNIFSKTNPKGGGGKGRGKHERQKKRKSERHIQIL